MVAFTTRHIGAVGEDRAKLLEVVGYGSLDELTAAAVPSFWSRQVIRIHLAAWSMETVLLVRLPILNQLPLSVQTTAGRN